MLTLSTLLRYATCFLVGHKKHPPSNRSYLSVICARCGSKREPWNID